MEDEILQQVNISMIHGKVVIKDIHDFYFFRIKLALMIIKCYSEMLYEINHGLINKNL